MVLLPNAFLWLRIGTAKRNNDRREVTVDTSHDHRDHILVYLFAMLLPFYSEDLGTLRDLAATFAALSFFIVFPFWHRTALHDPGVRRVWSTPRLPSIPPADGNPLTGKTRYAVITRRVSLSPGEKFATYRLSDTVYMEVE